MKTTASANKNWKDTIVDFMRKWYRENKILMWVTGFIILSGILPIFPSSETVKVPLDIPTFEKDMTTFPTIEIYKDCKSFAFSGPQQLQIPLLGPSDMEVYDKKINKVSYKFRGYNISIFSIKSCDDCIDDSSLRLLEEKKCKMNKFSVLASFEKCQDNKMNDYYSRVICSRIPFVLSEYLEVMSPEKEFKLEIVPYISKIKTKGERYDPIVEKYFIELIITYPKWKPLPYAKWIGTIFLFALDPLKSILKYFIDQWSW